jgi:hypothetical protein
LQPCPGGSPVALDGAAAGVIDEDAPHDDARNGQEVGAALPFDGFMAQELEEGLVDESGGLERGIGALAPHVLLGAGMKIVVHKLGKDRLCLAVTAAQAFELFRDLISGWRHEFSWMDEIIP